MGNGYNIMTWKLQTITGEFTGTEVSIERDMLVGRHQDADLLIQSADISRRHAAFLLKDKALWLQDLKSSNGTFVNDLRIEHETLLKQGDIVQFASHKFAVLEPATAAVEKSIDVPKHVQLEAVTLAQTEAAPAMSAETAKRVEPESSQAKAIQQPAEAIATSETAQIEPKIEPQLEAAHAPAEKSASQAMADQGMPDLKERDASVQLNREGMPQSVGVPKPAPIPEGVDIHAVKPIEEELNRMDVPAHCASKEEETQKNASIGLMALLAMIFIAVIAWFIFN